VHCTICSQPNIEEQAVMDAFYERVGFCPECTHSEAAIQWREAKRRKDKSYDRYLRLLTVGRPKKCSYCHTENYLYPKRVGYHSDWELCCDKCSRVDYQAMSTKDPSHAPLLSRLRVEYDAFLKKEHYPDMTRSLETMNEEWAQGTECSCGGSISIAAKPRCICCNRILMHSFFHYADAHPPQDQVNQERILQASATKKH